METTKTDKEAGLKARSSKIKCKSQNKWFDQECETEKGNLQTPGEKISKNSYNSELRQLLRDKKKRFKPQAPQAQNTWCMRQLLYIKNCMGKSPII